MNIFCRLGMHKWEIEKETGIVVRWRVCARPNCKFHDVYFVDLYGDRPNKVRPTREKTQKKEAK